MTNSDIHSNLFFKAKALYIEQLPLHINNLEELLLSIDIVKANEIYSIAHRLKGSSHILGFTNIGDTATELSEYLTSNLLNDNNHDSPIQQHHINSIKSYISQIKTYFEELK